MWHRSKQLASHESKAKNKSHWAFFMCTVREGAALVQASHERGAGAGDRGYCARRCCTAAGND